MKKWAKILVWIGIIWAILVLIGLTFFYFQVKNMITAAQVASVSNQDSNLGTLTSIINTNTIFVSLAELFFLLGLPSWIMFIISAIWGRGK